MAAQEIVSDSTPLYGGVESGGTKIVCIVVSGPDDIRAETSFPTETPESTLGRIIDFFTHAQREHGDIVAIGLASFGPVDLDADSPTYGYVTRTPKSGWSNTDVLGPLKQALGKPVAFDTDVNGAGIGEREWGAAQGLSNFVYMTIGTGIGGGVIVDGRPVTGISHPEIGHFRPVRDPARDPFTGICPFHGDCLEGLASGKAVVSRWNSTLAELGADHDALQLEANYLGQLCTTLTFVLSPQKIILGGGAAGAPGLLPAVRTRTREMLGGYLSAPIYAGNMDDYIVAPGLGKRAGVLGAVVMAQRLAADT